MEVLYIVPSWFYGYDALLQILFAIVSLMVSVYAYKIYKISKQKEARLFSYSFLLIFLSYIVLTLVSIRYTIPIDNDDTIRNILIRELSINTFVVYLHVLLFLAGLVTLAYTTLSKRDHRTYVLILSLIIGIVLTAPQTTNVVYMISSILTLFIFIHYFENYLVTKNNRLVLTTTAFFLLFLGSLDFIFSDSNHLYYVGGHLINLAAYLIILGVLIITVKHGKKKRQA